MCDSAVVVASQCHLFCYCLVFSLAEFQLACVTVNGIGCFQFFPVMKDAVKNMPVPVSCGTCAYGSVTCACVHVRTWHQGLRFSGPRGLQTYG